MNKIFTPNKSQTNYSFLYSVVEKVTNSFKGKFGFDLLRTVGLVMLVTLAYIWFVSVGLWTRFPESSYYYDMLATGFQHGELSLELKPDPLLLRLPKPYETSARSGTNLLMDASLYE